MGTPRRPVPSGVMTDPTARLRALVENGVAKRFDLRAWSAQSGCARARAFERLETLLEQARPDVIKLIVMESLQGTPESDLDVMVYGECAPRAFLEFINAHARTLALERAEEGDETRRGDARGADVLRFRQRRGKIRAHRRVVTVFRAMSWNRALALRARDRGNFGGGFLARRGAARRRRLSERLRLA